MSKTIKLSDTDYAELSRIKRELSAKHNREITLGETVGAVFRAYQALKTAIGSVGPEHPIHEDPDDSN